MIEEQATVIALIDEKITVETVVKSSCSACQQIDDCGSGQIAKAFNQKTVTFDIDAHNCSSKLSLGDRVVIGLPEKLLLSAAWQVYMLPLIGLFVGGGIGQWMMYNTILTHELYALALGLVFSFMGFQLAKRLQSKANNQNKWQPKLLKVLPQVIAVQQITP